MRTMIRFQPSPWALVMLALLLLFSACSVQRTFTSPNEAVGTLVEALRSGDERQLRDILGSSEYDLLSSGDEVADQENVEKFLAAYDEKHVLVPAENGAMSLVVGSKEWPLPIPIVKKDASKDAATGAWRFDTAAGRNEIINRRIGRNELDCIQICQAIADAQREYAMADPNHDGVPAYARKFISDQGQKNGLYWPTQEGEPPSPLGLLVAEAEAQGYKLPKKSNGDPSPYHGYYYRILTSQGPNAPGGARDYVVGKQLIGGFAVVAYPAEHGSSGIMTFIMNHDSIVYQRDFRAETAKIGRSMEKFDPDSSWKKAEIESEKP